MSTFENTVPFRVHLNASPTPPSDKDHIHLSHGEAQSYIHLADEVMITLEYPVQRLDELARTTSVHRITVSDAHGHVTYELKYRKRDYKGNSVSGGVYLWILTSAIVTKGPHPIEAIITDDSILKITVRGKFDKDSDSCTITCVKD